MYYNQIAAIVPFYDTYGQNSTSILLQDGTEEYASRPVKQYVAQMLFKLHLDPKALKFWNTSVLGTKLNTPLIIDENYILLPVKFRKSVAKADGCFGYVCASAITKVEDHKLTLSNGQTLTTYSPKSYIIKKQTDAKLLRYAYVDYKKQYEFMWKNPPSPTL